MLTLHISSLIKFLIGIVFLQGSTGLLVYTALRTDLTQTWPLCGALGVGRTAMTVGCHASPEGTRKEAPAKLQARFFRAREMIRVRARQDRLGSRAVAEQCWV